ncbi:MAG: phytanoyl-CoA dioxygenase family protein [bacterium]|jgi:hypothetical protein
MVVLPTSEPDQDSSSRDRGDYEALGYAILPPVPKRLIDLLSTELDGIISQGSTLPPDLKALCIFERDLPSTKRDGIPPSETGDAIFLVGDLCRFSPVFAAALAHPPLIAAVSAALETTDLVCHFSNATIKSARVGSGISWHRDAANSYMPTARSEYLRAMICLDGLSAENGGTSFLPASHLVAEAQSAPEFVMMCPPGSVVLIHPQVLHGGGPNRSQRARRNLIVQWGRRDDPVLGEHRETLTGLSPAEVAAIASAVGLGRPAE